MTYRIGANEPDSYEVTRTVRANVAAFQDLHDQLGRKWQSQPIRKIDVVEPIEDL